MSDSYFDISHGVSEKRKKKKGIQKNRELIEDNNDERDNYEVIEDNNDERDNYEVIDHTKLSPEQERNKPKHTWQEPRIE